MMVQDDTMQERRQSEREQSGDFYPKWEEVTTLFNEAFSQGQLVVQLADERVFLDESAQNVLSRSAEMSFGDLALICLHSDWLIARDERQTTSELEFLHGEGGRLKVFAWRIHDAQSSVNFVRFQTSSTLTSMPRRSASFGDRIFRQQQLFSIISHELRTPAATLAMLIDELEALDNAEVRRLYPQLKNSSEHLLSVLQDMRQAVNPTQNLPMRKVQFHPNRLLENIAAQMRSLAEQQKIELTCTLLSDEQLSVRCDIERVKLILLNLIKNALLHSRCSKIEVSAELVAKEQGQELVCRIRDNGRGIPPEEIERLYEPFERLDTPVDGSGLGLFIVHQTVDELGGKIVYKDVPEGGADFKIYLPTDEVKDDQVQKLLHASPSQVVPSTHNLLSRLRIIVVEDDPVIRMVSQRLLSKLVAQVDVAENGRIGLKKILEERYDLILTDFFMPEMDGKELIMELRTRGIQTPIIAVTAAVLGRESESLINAGANSIVAKPISMKSFITSVEDVLKLPLDDKAGSDEPISGLR